MCSEFGRRNVTIARHLAAAFALFFAVLGAAWGQGEGTKSAGGYGGAKIYVYRKGSISGARAHPLVFVNGELAAELDNDSYAEASVVSAGPTTVVSTETILGHMTTTVSQPGGLWTKYPGCSAIDWRKWASASTESAEACYAALKKAFYACDVVVPEGMHSALLQGSMGGHAGLVHDLHCTGREGRGVPLRCQQELEGSGLEFAQYSAITGSEEKCLIPKPDQIQTSPNPYHMLMLLHRGRRCQVNVEPGKSYYFRWSFGGNENTNKLVQVDESTGIKEMKKLHRVTN